MWTRERASDGNVYALYYGAYVVCIFVDSGTRNNDFSINTHASRACRRVLEKMQLLFICMLYLYANASTYSMNELRLLFIQNSAPFAISTDTHQHKRNPVSHRNATNENIQNFKRKMLTFRKFATHIQIHFAQMR